MDAVIVQLINPTFKLELPINWVNDNPEFKELVESRKSHITNYTKQLAEVMAFMNNAGFLAFEEKEDYSLSECRQIYNVLVSEWYSEYYSHTLWKKLRTGELSRNGLLGWLIHNYHTSKAAGMTDARAAIGMPSEKLRLFFKQNCLEEYWHCEAFYFVRHKNLNVDDEDIKSYVPLPSSLAFEQQATRTVEYDWMANVLISYFQESSIKFHDEAVKFYKEVEKNYEIEGMFDSWIQHMSLDLDHDHAAELGQLLESDSKITKEQFFKSIREANRSFRFLISSLDEILKEDVPSLTLMLRKPVRNGLLNPLSNSLLAQYQIESERSITDTSPIKLYHNLCDCSFNKIRGVSDLFTCSEEDAIYLHSQLVISFFRALSYADRHEEVILFGKLAEKPEYFPECFTNDHSLWITALTNFINSLSYKPRIFAFLLFHLTECTHEALASSDSKPVLPITEKGIKAIKNYLSTITLTFAEIDLCCNAIIQCNEFINSKDQYDCYEKPICFLG